MAEAKDRGRRLSDTQYRVLVWRNVEIWSCVRFSFYRGKSILRSTWLAGCWNLYGLLRIGEETWVSSDRSWSRQHEFLRLESSARTLVRFQQYARGQAYVNSAGSQISIRVHQRKWSGYWRTAICGVVHSVFEAKRIGVNHGGGLKWWQRAGKKMMDLMRLGVVRTRKTYGFYMEGRQQVTSYRKLSAAIEYAS